MREMKEMQEIIETGRTECASWDEQLSEYDEWLLHGKDKLFPPLSFVVEEVFPRVMKQLYKAKESTVTLPKKEVENILYLATLYAKGKYKHKKDKHVK